MNMLIGLSGPAGSGKSYCADYLQRTFGYRRVSFGQPMKDMLAALLLYRGVSRSGIERMLYGDLKEVSNGALNGQSPRHAMQTIGTAWGRDCMSPELWVSSASDHIRQLLRQGQPVIVDDVRFDNEAAAIHDLGGLVVGITGRSKGIPPTHVSEQGCVCDAEVDNSAGSDIAAELCAVHDGIKSEVFK